MEDVDQCRCVSTSECQPARTKRVRGIHEGSLLLSTSTTFLRTSTGDPVSQQHIVPLRGTNEVYMSSNTEALRVQFLYCDELIQSLSLKIREEFLDSRLN